MKWIMWGIAVGLMTICVMVARDSPGPVKIIPIAECVFLIWWTGKCVGDLNRINREYYAKYPKRQL